MIFDFHAHCYPDALAKKAVSVFPKELPGPFYDGSLPGLKGYLGRHGIGGALTVHIAGKPDTTRAVNDWAIECASGSASVEMSGSASLEMNECGNEGLNVRGCECENECGNVARHVQRQGSEPKILAFGSVHPHFGDYRAEIARLKSAGIRGLKFHPYYQHCDLCDPAAYRVYEEGARQGMIMLFHVGLDVLIPGEFGTTDKLARLLSDLKYSKIVAAHLGGSMTPNLAEQLIWGQDVYLDTSFSLPFLKDEQISRLIQKHDKTKLLFGTDGPWADPTSDFVVINRLFDAESQRLLYFENARRLLEF